MACDDYCNNYGCNRGPNCPARAKAAQATSQAIAQVQPPLAAVPTVEADQEGRMSLWRINLRLSPLELSHKTLADFGFHATYAPGATLANYQASDFPKICRAISDHALAAAKGAPK